jgi:hypothetical protein
VHAIDFAKKYRKNSPLMDLQIFLTCLVKISDMRHSEEQFQVRKRRMPVAGMPVAGMSVAGMSVAGISVLGITCWARKQIL